jgi:hypothetical protein
MTNDEIRNKSEIRMTTNIMKKLCSLFACFACFAGTLLADNFNITNAIWPAVSIVGFPTNTVGTNGIGNNTGGAIGLANNNFATFNFQALPIPLGATAPYGAGATPALQGTNQGTITIQFVRSTAGQTPGVVNSTNAWYGNTNAAAANIAQSDWETTPAGGALTVSFTFTGTNAINWSTNWIDPQLAAATYIGIYSISNGVTGSGTNTLFLTNVVATLAKKIIPIRYP